MSNPADDTLIAHCRRTSIAFHELALAILQSLPRFLWPCTILAEESVTRSMRRIKRAQQEASDFCDTERESE